MSGAFDARRPAEAAAFASDDTAPDVTSASDSDTAAAKGPWTDAPDMGLILVSSADERSTSLYDELLRAGASCTNSEAILYDASLPGEAEPTAGAATARPSVCSRRGSLGDWVDPAPGDAALD